MREQMHLLAAVAAVVAEGNIALAHPGHGHAETVEELGHWLTSGDHLLVLGVAGMATYWLAWLLIRTLKPKRQRKSV